MIFVGIDWAEAHHDVCVLDDQGGELDAFRIPEGLEGVSEFHDRLGEHVDDPDDVVIGMETDRGLLVAALAASGYQLYAINPLSVSRYRDRHTVSGAKSDRGDAKVLADIVRTDRHNHRPAAPDSELVQAIRVLARTHQSLIWTRQRQVNQMRSGLRQYYPAALEAFGTDLVHPDALEVLAKAPTPEQGRRLSIAQIRSALKRGGRRRNIDRRAEQIRAALRTDQLQAPALVADAFGTTIAALVPVVATLEEQINEIEARLSERFEQHPDAELILSLPGLGVVLGARVLAEFGDAPNRYADAKPAAITRGPHQSPKHRGPHGSLSHGSSAIGGWSTPAGSGLLRADRLTRRAHLLRRPQPRSPHVPDRSTEAREQARRHPPRRPRTPHPLQQTARVRQLDR